MDKVSLIMPAYNASAYLGYSVGSVLEQSYSNVEIIVIDDGSKDDTAAILAEMSAKDSRVRPFTIANGGPANARNFALQQLAPDSRYIMFIDADDRLEPDAVEYALSGMAGDADMVVFGFSIVNTDGTQRDYCEPAALIPFNELGQNLARLYKANLLNQVWGKMYRAELIKDNGISFPDYRWGEDRMFIFGCLENCRGISVLPECKYRYIMHPGESLITKFLANKADICIEIDKRMDGICRRCGVTEDSDFRYMFAKSIFSCMANLFSPSCRLSHREKLDYVGSVISSDYVQQRCKGAGGGMAVKGLCMVMATRVKWLNLFTFRMVAFAGKAAPKLFMKLKHRK